IIEKLPWQLTIKKGQSAFWSPNDPDAVTMPDHKSFRSSEEFYSVLMHEIVHASGFETRLNRDMTGKFGDEEYGLEELVAEFGSAFICARC
ncbi:zincin-like metallopeptidase domain-containing protein, partial [Acinetobacter baumannii]